MASRVAPSRHQADNPAGSRTLAACTDWPDVRRFHVGTDHCESTTDAGYTTARASYPPELSINFLAFRGSPYTQGWASRLQFSPSTLKVLAKPEFSPIEPKCRMSLPKLHEQETVEVHRDGLDSATDYIERFGTVEQKCSASFVAVSRFQL